MSVYMYNYVNFLSFIFRDLIEQFRPWLKDALDLRKSDVREREREGEREMRLIQNFNVYMYL